MPTSSRTVSQRWSRFWRAFVAGAAGRWGWGGGSAGCQMEAISDGKGVRQRSASCAKQPQRGERRSPSRRTPRGAGGGPAVWGILRHQPLPPQTGLGATKRSGLRCCCRCRCFCFCCCCCHRRWPRPRPRLRLRWVRVRPSERNTHAAAAAWLAWPCCGWHQNWFGCVGFSVRACIFIIIISYPIL